MNDFARLQTTVCHTDRQQHRYWVEHARLEEALAGSGCWG